MFFSKKASKFRKLRTGGQSVRTGMGRSKESPTILFFETGRLIEVALLCLFSALVVIICFLGQTPKGPSIILNQVAPTRIVSEFNFEYKSAVEAEERAAAVRAQIPPVFRLSMEPFKNFRKFISDLSRSIAGIQIDYEDKDNETLESELLKTVKDLIETYKFQIQPEQILRLASQANPQTGSMLFKEVIPILEAIHKDGIYSDNRTTATQGPQIAVIQLPDKDNRQSLPNAQTEEYALHELWMEIDALSPDRSTARTLFDLFSAGISPNLLYSADETNQAAEKAVSQLEPPIIRYEKGDTLIEPGSIVSTADIERIGVYQQLEQSRGSNFDKLFIKRLLLTAILLIAVYIYIRPNLRGLNKRNHIIAITAVSILLNLLIIRIIMELGEIVSMNNRPSLSMLPYMVPCALTPILVSAFAGGAPALLSSLIIAVIFGILQNNSIELFLIVFLSGVVGGVLSGRARKRSKLVRAGLWAGATEATAGALISLLNGFSLGLVGQQTLITLAVGLLTGILVVGLFPIFEYIFKVSTEITLLELTDFNHPLLRKMQMEAPGTYHHSLMVANLSENAAAVIGAGPLLCRACCLFHDIGKLVKPEYFVENQRDGVNPHDRQIPSMSALIIKAHVKEGVEMARKYKLPHVIMEVIRQHHGTSLIQYFYHQAKAKEREKQGEKNKIKDGSGVDESTYRYDGSKPKFKESAIIFFADSVEAASRSLKKVTQPNVEELIDNIFKNRIEDGQLDNCPLTFKELDLIRTSFIHTLLNMLHVRIGYPKRESGKADPDPPSTPKA